MTAVWFCIGCFVGVFIGVFVLALFQGGRRLESARCPECNEEFEAPTEDRLGDLLYIHLLTNHREPPEEEL